VERVGLAAVIRRALGLAVLAVVLAACGAAPPARAHSRPKPVPTPSTGSAPDTAPSPPGTLRVLGLGDSVMAGTNCGCSGLVEEYAGALARRTGRPVHVDNLGANGAVTSDLLEDLDSDERTRSLAAQADVVVVTIGANDLIPQLQTWEESGCPARCFTTAANEVGRRLTRVLRALTAARGGSSDHVLVTDYWNVFRDGKVALEADGVAERDWSDRVTSAANTAICRAAQAAGATCVDLVAPFKGAGDRDPTPLLADDGDHPNAAGMKVIVDALMRATPADL
jgi:lysophospholipase L1-like esterase